MRWCASALALLVAGVASAQEIGGAWFIERGRSQPIAMLTVGRIDDLFGVRWLDLDVSALVRPLDGVRLGGAVTFSALIARNAWATIGVGGLSAERWEWSAVRPGLIFGVAVRF